MIQTTVTGTLYKPDGSTITSGNLTVSLSEMFTSIDGNIVQPFRYTLAITGAFTLSLFATENMIGGIYTALSPSSSRVYTFEFDPDPTDNTPISTKNGYFKKTLSIPHVSDTPLSNTYALSAPSAVKTLITGSLYDSSGTIVSSGKLRITPYESFTSINGAIVAPFTIEYTITGALSLYLFATENTIGGSYTTYLNPITRYVVELDPDPSTTSIELNRKDGYFKNTISVPHVSDTPGSNTKNIKDIYSVESTLLDKKYGYGNILNNNAALLTQDQHDMLSEHGTSANELHTHTLGSLSYLKMPDQDSSPTTPNTNNVKLYYTKGLTGGLTYGAMNVLFENGSVLYMFSEGVS